MIALCNDVDQRSPHIRASFASLCRGRRRHIIHTVEDNPGVVRGRAGCMSGAVPALLDS